MLHRRSMPFLCCSNEDVLARSSSGRKILYVVEFVSTLARARERAVRTLNRSETPSHSSFGEIPFASATR
jgi:hypothetical protein